MSEIFNFELVKEKYLVEFNTIGRYFKHIPSGAELLSLEEPNCSLWKTMMRIRYSV